MRTETELYQTTVRMLDEAAQWISKRKKSKAIAIIESMDVEVYEYSLDLTCQNDRNVDYYCARFVFAAIENASDLRTSKEQVCKYWGNWFFWKGFDPHPRWVTIHSIRYDLTQTEMPLEVERKQSPTQPAQHPAQKPKAESTIPHFRPYQLWLFQTPPTSVRAFA